MKEILAKEFFTVLYQTIPNKEDLFYELRLIKPDPTDPKNPKKTKRESRFYEWPQFLHLQESQAYALIRTKNEQGYNVYFGINPRLRKHGKKADVACDVCLFADIDAKDFLQDKTEKDNEILDAIVAIKPDVLKHIEQTYEEKKIPPSILVDSGRGYQLYWLLTKVSPFPENGRRQALIDNIERLNKILEQLFHGDSIGNVDRIFRYPGSYNRKPVKVGSTKLARLPVKILRFTPDLRYPLETFHRLAPPEQPKPQHKAKATTVPKIDDSTVLEKALKHPDFKALWEGNTDKYGSPSEADFALCCKLAFWTGKNREQIDALFRKSGLYREKWKDKRGNTTYGWYTIDKAIEAQKEVYQPKPKPPHREEYVEKPNTTTHSEHKATEVYRNIRKQAIALFKEKKLQEGLDLFVQNWGNISDVLTKQELISLVSQYTKQDAGALVNQAFNKPISDPPGNSNKKRQKASAIAEFLRKHHSFGYNDLESCPYVDGKQLSDDIDSLLHCECVDAGFGNKALITDVVVTLARKNIFHPIKQYFEGLHYDGKEHIKTFSKYVTDTQNMFYTVIRKWMIQAVRKVYTGAQNEVLVLVGAQGIGKSLLAAWLCPKALKEYYVECGQIDPTNKDHLILHATNFMGEVGELGSTTKTKEVRALKEYFTKQTITYRPPYGKRTVKKPACMSFIGTENEDGTGFLRDTTGNRRYIPIDLVSINWAYSKECNVDQMWAEAYTAYRKGEDTELTQHQKALLAGIIDAHTQCSVELEYLLGYFEITGNDNDWVYALEILSHMESLGYNERKGAAKYKIAQELNRLGVKKIRGRRGTEYHGIQIIKPSNQKQEEAPQTDGDKWYER